MIAIGFDPGTARLGFGVIETDPYLHAHEFGIVVSEAGEPMASATPGDSPGGLGANRTLRTRCDRRRNAVLRPQRHDRDDGGTGPRGGVTGCRRAGCSGGGVLTIRGEASGRWVWQGRQTSDPGVGADHSRAWTMSQLQTTLLMPSP